MNRLPVTFQLEEETTSNTSAKNKYKYKHIRMCLSDYFDNCLHILTVAFFAEILMRIFKALKEYIYYRNHYWPNQIDILYRTFSTTAWTKTFFLITMGGLLSKFGPSNQLLPPLTYFLYMPLYWLWCWASISHSTLDYALSIRERTGLDYAEGMAASYFHGYLQQILPANMDGIKERIELFEAQHNIEFAVKKLVIIIPDTLYVSPTIHSRCLEKRHELEVVRRGRAGVMRSFKNDVYRITEQINGHFYYVALEGATPLLTFFEAMHFQLTTTWQMEELHREILLKFYNTLKHLVNVWPSTRDEVELIFYKSYKMDGSPQDIGELLKSHFKRQWKENNSISP